MRARRFRNPGPRHEPPYGERTGERDELAAFYPKLGDALKHASPAGPRGSSPRSAAAQTDQAHGSGGYRSTTGRWSALLSTSWLPAAERQKPSISGNAPTAGGYRRFEQHALLVTGMLANEEDREERGTQLVRVGLRVAEERIVPIMSPRRKAASAARPRNNARAPLDSLFLASIVSGVTRPSSTSSIASGVMPRCVANLNSRFGSTPRARSFRSVFLWRP